MRSLRSLGFVGLTLVLLAGCGPPEEKGVTVTGQVVRSGVPLSVPNMEVGLGYVEVVLQPVGEGSVEYSMAEADGKFTFIGEKIGIKPGDYKLAVYQRSEGPQSDDLEGKFSVEKTTVHVTISADHLGGQQDLGVIDLDKT